MAPEGHALRRSVLEAFLWLGTGTTIIQTVSWVSTIVVIRLLSPADYGLMAMTSVCTVLLSTVGELGISSALIQARELNTRQIRQVFAWVLITGVTGVTIAYASAPAVAGFYDQPALIPLVRVMAFSVLLVMLYVVPQSLFVRDMNFKAKAQIDIVAQLTSVAVTLICAVNGMGVWSLVSGLMTLHLIKAAGYNVARGWTLPLFDLRGSLGLLKYGITVTGDRSLNFFYQESDKIVVGRFLGDSALGTYSVALTLGLIPMEKVLPIITQVSFASYARMQNDRERVRRNLLRSTRAVSLVSFPLFFGMSAVAPLAIPLLLGERWRAIVIPFQLICLILPLRSLGPILASALHGLGRPGVSLVNMIILSTSMMAALLAGVQYGLLGVCIVWLAVYPAILLVTTRRTLREIGIPLGRYLSEIRFPFFASALMLLTIQLLQKMIVTGKPVYSLLMAVIFGVAFYSSLVLTLKRQEYAEFRSLLRR